MNINVTANAGEIPTMAGRIRIIHELNNGIIGKANWYMKVYRTENEHKAYVYTDVECTFCFGYMNMGKCNVESGENSNRVCITKRICQTGYNRLSKGLIFDTSNSLEARKWITCLSHERVANTTSD